MSLKEQHREVVMHRFASLFTRSFLVVFGLVLVSGLASPVSGADIYVDRTADLHNGNCIIQCSLRDAILISNTNGQDDTIHVPAGHYTLTIPQAGFPDGTTGSLRIDSPDSVKIVGDGPGITVIDGNAIDRVLTIQMNSGTVGLQGLTIQGGSTPYSGGGIYNLNTTLIINSCEITGNHVTDTTHSHAGGGIYQEEGLLWINDGVISNNNSDNKAGGLYAGIGSTLQLQRCAVHENTAYIAAAGVTRGDAYFHNVTFFNNIASNDVGGVWVEGGTATFTHCTMYHGLDLSDEAIFCRAGGALAILRNTIVHGVCNVEEANIDAQSGNVEYGDTCFMGYGNYHSAGSSTGLMQFGWHGGGVPTQELGDWGVSDNYVFTGTHLLAEDARGSARPVGAYGDSGAYELIPGEIFSHDFENKYTTGWSNTVP